MRFAIRLLLVPAALVGFHVSQPSALAQATYSHGDPTAQEQLILELVNKARANPPAAGVQVGQASAFAAYPARPPLAFHAALLAAAAAHNADLDAHGTFSHTGSDGSTPGERVVDAGYPGSADSVGESIAFGFPSPLATVDALLIDSGTADLGHRRNYLEYDKSNNFFREFGAAFDTDAHALSTQDFASRQVALITGVTFKDADGDDFYSVGEGVSGVSVSSPQSSYVTTTSTSGGYALPMDKVSDLATGVTVVFHDGSEVYTRHLALASTTGDGAPDNVESDLNFNVDTPDVEVATVTVQVRQATADAATGAIGSVVFKRTGGDLSGPLTIKYKARGTAGNGTDYKMLPGTLTIPAGSASAKLKIKPLEHPNFPAGAVVKVSLRAGSGYVVGDTANAKVNIVNAP